MFFKSFDDDKDLGSKLMISSSIRQKGQDIYRSVFYC